MLTAGIVNAQSTGNASTSPIKFGLKAGLNYSNIIKSGDDDFSTEFKPGFHAGIFVEIPIVPVLSFAPELVYSQKGYKATGSVPFFGDYDYRVTTNFIEAPLLAKINAAPGFSIVVGPQVSFLTSTSTSFKNGGNAYEQTVEEDNDNLKKSLVGGVVGVGFDASPNISINARYALYLQKNNEDGSSQTPAYRNQVFQVGLGFKF